MSWSADLVERVDQGVLVVGPERDVEVSRSTRGRGTKALPVVWDGFPGVLHTHVMPRRC